MNGKTYYAFNENPYFLQSDDYAGTTMFCGGADSNLVSEDGHMILKGGTIWPSNDANALGIVLRDTVVGPEGATFTCLYRGYINPDYLPAAPSSGALGALPKTILFSNPGTDNTNVPSGYFLIAPKNVGSHAAGLIDAATLEALTIKVDRVGSYDFKATADQNILDWKVSNFTYPVSVKSVTVSSHVATIVLTCDHSFHCHSGEEITLTCQPGCFTAGSNVEFPSNTITICKFN